MNTQYITYYVKLKWKHMRWLWFRLDCARLTMCINMSVCCHCCCRGLLPVLQTLFHFLLFSVHFDWPFHLDLCCTFFGGGSVIDPCMCVTRCVQLIVWFGLSLLTIKCACTLYLYLNPASLSHFLSILPIKKNKQKEVAATAATTKNIHYKPVSNPMWS